MSRRIKLIAVIDDAALAEAVRTELGGHEISQVTTMEQARARVEAAPDLDLVLLCEIADGGPVSSRISRLRRGHREVAILILSAAPESPHLGIDLQSKQLTDAVALHWRSGELLLAALRLAELVRSRRELEAVRKEMHRRVEDLQAMNELTAAIADVSTDDELAQVVARGLFRVAPDGVGAAMLATEDGATLHIHCHQPSGRGALRAVRDRCVDLFRSLTGREIREEKLHVDVSGERLSLNEQREGAGVLTHVPVHVDGQIVGLVLVSSSASLFADAEKQMYFLATRAAEAVRRVAEQRASERRRLSLMVESMADGLIFTGDKADRVLINPAARHMLGIGPTEPVTTQYLRDKLGFYPFELVGARSQSATELVREELTVGDRSLHSIVSPVRDRAGKLVGVVVVLRDITEARELTRRQSEFVSVISHELRTPLTSIAGVLDIMASGFAGRVTDKQKRYLDMARASCNQLSGIVDDLLDVARSDKDKMPVQFTPLLLGELAEEAVRRFRDQSEAKGIRLRIHLEKRDIRIVGDADRLHQVLSNLLSNAIKFAPKGGDVEVDVFGSSVVADHVGVAVFNSGEPIPKEARERVFAKFEQLEDASTRRVGGTGLGLPISRAIIEAHGGRIWAESLDAGTRFVFIVPVAPGTEVVAEDRQRDRDNASHGTPDEVGEATVLIVDDDRHSSYILKGVLMAAGYDVMLAEDPDSALSAARDTPPHLAVISSATAEGPLIDLVEIFSHDPDMRKTAVLVLSSSPSARELALRAGASEVLAQPMRPAEFLDSCTRLLKEAGGKEAHRVLVVDDDATIRLICREVLENAGYSVRDVGDGDSAVAEARRFRPDVMLLDIMMPHMDGFRTAELLRADPATAMTPIIFVSAKGETQDKVRAFRAGAEDYVVKPFDAAELVARVSKSVERQARELGASPTTQLPGADAIEAEIERRMATGESDAFCYLDLDNLKAFNDYYGYAKADGVIRQTGDLIRDIIAREGSTGDFIGHIAGDDFVFITAAERVVRVCKTICSTFDRLVPLYYDKHDREKGFIEAKDRYGVLRQFPIMTVSVAAVTLAGNRIKSFSDLAAVAAQGKKLAKEVPGSSFVLNGEVIVGERPITL